MQTHNAKQGSKEWLELRKDYLTASEASAMMGLSSYKTRNQLLTEKKTGIIPDVDPATQARFDNGHKTEEMARPIAEKIIGEELFNTTGTKDIEDLHLLASFDGLTLLNDVVWEHKLLNNKLKESLSSGVIPDEYLPQLDQQLLVSGAEKALFMASDGTSDNCYHVWYEPEIDSIAPQLINGWKQFEEDLKTFEAQEPEVIHEERTIDSLPSLSIQAKGEIINSNLDTYKKTALAFIESIRTDLGTDDDFFNANKTVKWLSESEKKLEATKEQILGQTATIDEAFNTIDSIKEQMRQKRLFLDKQVKQQRQQKKENILQTAITKFKEHIQTLNEHIRPVQMPVINADFAGVMKGKSLFSSMQDAVDTELARVKIESNEVYAKIKSNLNSLSALAADYKFLFNDLQNIVNNESDYFDSLIKMRIHEHKESEKARIEAEQKRLEEEAHIKAEAEREAIRREEQQKAEAQARQKLEEERKQAEEKERLQRDSVDVKQADTQTEPKNLETPKKDVLKLPPMDFNGNCSEINNLRAMLDGNFSKNDLINIINYMSELE